MLDQADPICAWSWVKSGPKQFGRIAEQLLLAMAREAWCLDLAGNSQMMSANGHVVSGKMVRLPTDSFGFSGTRTWAVALVSHDSIPRISEICHSYLANNRQLQFVRGTTTDHFGHF